MATDLAESSLTAYEKLLVEYKPRPLKSASAYRRALKQIDRLFRQPRISRPETELLELLSSLVAEYEREHFSAPEVSPAQILAHLIEARAVSQADVARATGIPRQTITNIINGSRGASQASRKRLAEYFNVSPEVFRSAG